MARDIVVPVDHVVAIYARENGQGMAFPVPAGSAAASDAAPGEPQAPSATRGLRLATSESDAPPAAGAAPRPPAEDPPEPTPPPPSLKRIK